MGLRLALTMFLLIIVSSVTLSATHGPLREIITTTQTETSHPYTITENRTVATTLSTTATTTLTDDLIGTVVTLTLSPIFSGPNSTIVATGTLKDYNGTAISNQPISLAFNGTRPASLNGAVTDAQGVYNTSFTSPQTAGTYFVGVSFNGTRLTSTASLGASRSTGTSLVVIVAGGEIISIPSGAGTGEPFTPEEFRIPLGTAITFEDKDGTAQHRIQIIAATGAVVSTSPSLGLGQAYAVTLNATGAYTFECEYHTAWMKGSFSVFG